MYDLGDLVSLTFQNVDSSGNPVAGAVTLTITLPDGTIASPSATAGPVGTYTANYATTQIGLHGYRFVGTSSAYADVFTTTDPALLPIVSLADAKSWVNLPASDTSNDQKIRDTLAAATEQAELYCGRALRRKTVVESHPGGDQALLLQQSPILSITSIVDSYGNTYNPSMYRADSNAGVLYRWGWVWGTPPFYQGDNVTVTYVAGYAAPPQAAYQGVRDIFRWLWQTTQQGPRPGFGQSGQETMGGDALPNWLFRPLDRLALPTAG